MATRLGRQLLKARKLGNRNPRRVVMMTSRSGRRLLEQRALGLPEFAWRVGDGDGFCRNRVLSDRNLGKCRT
jgi:ribosomal protein L34